MLLPGLALAFATGIALGDHFDPSPLFLVPALAQSLFVLLFAYQRPTTRGVGVLLWTLALCAGLLRVAVVDREDGDRPPVDISAQPRTACIEKGPWPSDEERWWADGTIEVSPGRIEGLRLYGCGSPSRFAPGDCVAFRSELRRRLPTGNPGERELPNDAPKWTAWVSHPRAVVLLERPTDGAPSLVRRRHALALHLRELVGEREGGVMAALGLGVRQLIDREVRTGFSTTGTAHALAVSGLHLGLVGLWVHVLLRWLLTRSAWLLLRVRVDRLVAACTLLAMFGFTLATGAAIATVRALVMAAVFLTGRIVDGHVAPGDALAVAVMTLLGANPESLTTPSFQLSVAAVAGILLAAPFGVRVQRRHLVPGSMGPVLLAAGRTLWGALWVSLAAGVATSPVVAAHFHQATPGGLVANLVAVPLLALVVLPLALFAVFALLLAPTSWQHTLLALPRWGTELWLDALAFLAERTSAPLVTSEPVPVLAAALGALFVLLALRHAVRPLVRAMLFLAGALLLACPSLHWTLDTAPPEEGFRAFVLNVGHGNALVLETPDGNRRLIDGGGARSGEPGVGRARVLPALRSLGIDRLDTAVLSHGHADHAVGLLEVLETLPVGELWLPDAPTASPYIPKLAELASRHGTKVVQASRGVPQPQILWPNPHFPFESENDHSVVLRVAAPGGSLLVPGDIEAEAESLLADSGVELRAAVMLAPHHGSATSSTAQLLDAVRPRAVIFSRGRGHRPALPHPEVLARYRRRAVLVFDTAVDGAIEVRATTSGIGLRSSPVNPSGQRRCCWSGTWEEARSFCF